MKYLATLGVLALALFPALSRCDEGDDALAKQKAAAEADWKKLEFKDKAAPIETANLIVYSRLNEAKTKTLATNLDKMMVVALKALKYDAMERPWPGKLIVFLIPDRTEFVEFMRKVARKSPDESSVSYSSVSGDLATMAVGAPRSGMHDVEESARNELANVLLQRKLGGAEPPEWLVTGFARASAHRAANKTAKAVPSPRLPFKELWNESLTTQQKASSATYFVDYFAYGPMSDAFPALVGALRRGENGEMPMLKDVLEAIKMDEAAVDYYAAHWKKPPAPKPPTKPKDKPKPDKGP